jgi:hypothetical protein
MPASTPMKIISGLRSFAQNNPWMGFIWTSLV